MNKENKGLNHALIQGVLCSHNSSYCSIDRAWIKNAVNTIEADLQRSADTHLMHLKLDAFPHIDFYLKDESTHPTGSLKHRLARSLFLYGLCNGFIHKDTTIVEASSGSTAISEAYFARLLGLKFIAVVPTGTSSEKLNSIKSYGGEIAYTESHLIYDEAQRIARSTQGHYMDQFTYAERVTDWRGNNNIAESLFQQMEKEPYPIPSWVVVGAGTGGTSATLGRYMRYKAGQFEYTKLCVADPQGSAFYGAYTHQSKQAALHPSRIEGVGRPRIEPSFVPSIVDKMIKVKDAASIATAYWLESIYHRKIGGSTGLNMFAALSLATEMKAKEQRGSIVTLLCDDGARYHDTIHQPAWLAAQGIDIAPYLTALQSLNPVRL